MPVFLSITALLWGFAEASLFFVVPDVLVSFVALRYGLRSAIAASVAASLAAAFGGAVVYLWAATDPAGANAAIAALPAIDASMIGRVSDAFERGGYGAMLAGAFSGVPYKIYAAAAGESGRALLPFLLVTPLVRLPRFVLAAVAVTAVDRLAAPRIAFRLRLALLAGFWMLFYGWYFAVMP